MLPFHLNNRRGVLLGGAMFAACGTMLQTPVAQAANVTPTGVPGVFDVQGAPEGFDPVHASDEQLAAYAFPPRPDARTQKASYAKWLRAMAMRRNQVFATPQVTSKFHGPTALVGRHLDAQARNTVYDSSNWSGFANVNGVTSYNSSTSFYFIISDFVIPAAKAPVCSGATYYASEWAGIDGFNSGDVLQAGVETDASCTSSSSSTRTYAWIEWYPYNESAISLPVAIGDDMFVEVWDVSSTSGYAFVENLNTGSYQEYHLTAKPGTVLVGNSAEWIVEAPTVNGSQSSPVDYTLDYFSGAGAYSFAGSGFYPGSSTSVQLDMDQGGTIYSTPALLGTTAIGFTYN